MSKRTTDIYLIIICKVGHTVKAFGFDYFAVVGKYGERALTLQHALFRHIVHVCIHDFASCAKYAESFGTILRSIKPNVGPFRRERANLSVRLNQRQWQSLHAVARARRQKLLTLQKCSACVECGFMGLCACHRCICCICLCERAQPSHRGTQQDASLIRHSDTHIEGHGTLPCTCMPNAQIIHSVIVPLAMLYIYNLIPRIHYAARNLI